MSYNVEVLADSISPGGHRLTSLVATFPRFILAEFNTHRMLSRNAASSRAIPIGKQIEAVVHNPFVPARWGSNKHGMQAGIDIDDVERANAAWLEARDAAMRAASELFSLGVHKQLANRLLEPFLWTTVVVSATDWDNFFHLRASEEAQPEFKMLALLMREAIATSQPTPKEPREWHLPFIKPEETILRITNKVKISAARCARVSYLTHDGKRDPVKDLDLAKRLLMDGHMSPFEHPAVCQTTPRRIGNFTGWTQLRKLLPNEADPKGVIA